MVHCQNKCLICSAVNFEDEYHEGGQKLSEILENENTSQVFQVLCQYMNWSIEDDLQLDFTSDPFPFCGQCLPPLLRLHHLHQDIQDLLTEARKITAKMTKVILETFDVHRVKIATGSGRGRLSEVCQVNQTGEKNQDLDEKLRNYRICTYRQYMPRVRVARKDHHDFTDVDPKQPTNVLNPDDDDAGLCIIDCYSVLEVGSDYPDASDISWNEDDKEMPSTSYNSNKKGPRKRKNDPRSLMNKFEENPEDRRTGLGGKLEEGDHVQETRLHLFSSTKWAKNVEQIGETTFTFNKRRRFQFVDNHEWKCLQCNYSTLKKQQILVHLGNKSKKCITEKPATALKEFKYKRVFYDQFKDLHFECRLCVERTDNDEDMKAHIDSKHQSRNTKFGSLSQLMEMFIREKDDEFACESCNEHFSSKKNAYSHLRRKHTKHVTGPAKKMIRTKKVGPNKYMFAGKTFEFRDSDYCCCECGYKSGTLASMQQHMNYKHTNKTTKKVCEECGRAFNSAQLLRLHQRRCHSGPGTIFCEQCGKAFVTEFFLRLHQKDSHGERKFMCDTCGLAFPTSYRMNVHKRVHETVTCEICGKLLTKLSIKSHRLMHAQVKTFDCDTCSKTFAYKNSLVTHKESCGGVKPYSCDLCGMSFIQSHSPIHHKKVVHGVDPDNNSIIECEMHPCDLCGVNFTQNKFLTIHKKQMHGAGANDVPRKISTCGLCHKSLKGTKGMRRHMMNVHGVTLARRKAGRKPSNRDLQDDSVVMVKD